MPLESFARHDEHRQFWTVKARTNAIAIVLGLLMALLAFALLRLGALESSAADALAAGERLALQSEASGLSHTHQLAALVLLALLLYCIGLPIYLRRVYSLMRINNQAASLLIRGETDLPELPIGRRDEFGHMARALLRMRDLTEELRRKTQTDLLTGLANREGLQAALDEVLDLAHEQVGRAGLLLVDLKRFRHLNHAYGIATGDLALQTTAERLKVALPEARGLARLQADRYGLVLSLADSEPEARQAATVAVERLRSVLGAPMHIDGHALTVDARVGIALFPDDGSDGQKLMIAAEAALAVARRSIGDVLRFADPGLSQSAQRTASVVAEIRQGIAAGEFMPHYEPIIDIGTGEIHGAEALARWFHPQRGIIAPAEFIPLAEDMGLIEQLTGALLPRICADAAGWNAKGIQRGISVNLSARELNHGFVDRLAKAIAHSGLAPECVTVELTETAMVEHPALALQVLRAIKALGVTLSLDDFGTGFSSLSHLQRFPIDNVKIDRSFVAELPHSPRARRLIEAMLAMARSLNLGVVAEGVETRQQARMLGDMGCLRQQGYLYAKALSADAFSRRISGLLGELRGLSLSTAS